MKVDAPLRVEIPSRGADQPSWVRVGVIAALGFVIGVGWPRLVGAHIGPSVPSDVAQSASDARTGREAPSGAAASPSGGAVVASSASASPAPAASGAKRTAAADGALPLMTVNHGVLLSCRNEDGQTLKGVTACGGLSGFDAIAQPRLRKLSSCPATSASTSGKLSVVMNLDFTTHRVAVDVGKSSTVSDPQGFAECVKSSFQGVSLGALDHQNPRYTLGYNVLFSPTDPAAPASSGPSDGIPVAALTKVGAPAPAPSAMGSSATPTAPPAKASKGGSDDANVEVAWEVAIVRDAPRTGSVVARLPRGTKVRLGTTQDGWYKIDYGPGTEGWVYRGAVGR